MPLDYQSLAPTERQRLPEYKRDDQWIKTFLHRSLIGHVAHLSGEMPYITPTNFWFDEESHRIIFHSNVTGRVHSNLKNQSKVCFETSEYGRFLPSNAALEFSLQYRSVMVFGQVNLITDPDERKHMLTALISKYFPDMRAGFEYRPITSKELERTAVYSIKINSWSGKENWQDQAEQIKDWPPLPKDVS
jgi:uncharacterized protein